MRRTRSDCIRGGSLFKNLDKIRSSMSGHKGLEDDFKSYTSKRESKPKSNMDTVRNKMKKAMTYITV